MSHDPSAGQPRNKGRYAHRTNSEPSGLAALGKGSFPEGARVAGNGTIGFVNGSEQIGSYIPVDDGRGALTVYIKERDLINLDELMDEIMPQLEGSYAPDDAFDYHGAQQAMDVLGQLARDRTDKSGHMAYVEAICALGDFDSTPADFESAAALLAGTDHLPEKPDVCTPERASRLARHFAGKAAEKARDRQPVDAAMYADVAVIFAGGPDAAGSRHRIAMVSRLRNGDDTADEFLAAVFSGEFDPSQERPHTYKV